MTIETRWPHLGASRWIEIALVLLLLLAGLMARIWCLQDESVWYDEHLLFHNLLGERDFHDFFTELRRTDPPVTPVYFTGQYYWTKLVGISELSLRLPSVAFSLAANVVLYALVRRMYGKSAAWIALLLASLSNLHIYYGQEIRVYALSLLLSTCSMYGFYRACHEGERRWYVLHYAASLLMIFTHFYTAFLLVAQGVYLLLLQPRRPWRAVPWALGHLPGVLLLAGWISTMDLRALDKVTVIGRSEEFLRIFVRCISWDGAWLPHAIFQGEIGMAPPLLALMGLGLWSWRQRSHAPLDPKPGSHWNNYLFLCCWLVVPPLCLLLLSSVRETVFYSRYVFYGSFALFAIFGGAISVIRSCRARSTVLAASVALLLWQCLSETRPFRPDDFACAEWISEHKAPADRVFYSPPGVGLVSLPKFFPELNIESGHAAILPRWLDLEPSETLWVIYNHQGLRIELEAHEDALRRRGLRVERVRTTDISHAFVYTSLRRHKLAPYCTVVYRIGRDAPAE